MLPPGLRATHSPGQVVAGRFKIERVLGAGGMGVVVAAEVLKTGERIALKLLLPEAREAHDLARFSREAKVASQISSEHAARAIEAGVLEDGTPYLAMELLEGADLQTLVGARGPLPVGEATLYLLQACEAVAEAHDKGIVHRDLKPANLFLTSRPDGSPIVKVLDFGLSMFRTGGAGEPRLTTSASAMGTPLYMAPEQIEDAKGVDERADVWSLGVILFELVAGRPPFSGTNAAAALASVLTKPPLLLRDARPDAPAELEALVARCLEKDRARRVASARDLAAALRAFAWPVSRISSPGPAAQAPGSGEAPVTSREWEQDTSAEAQAQSPAIPFAIGAGIAALISASLLGLALTAGPAAPSPPSPAVASVVTPEAALPRPGPSAIVAPGAGPGGGGAGSVGASASASASAPSSPLAAAPGRGRPAAPPKETAAARPANPRPPAGKPPGGAGYVRSPNL